MHSTVVLNVVGLTPSLLGEHTPHLTKLCKTYGHVSVMPPLPAVTCTAQSSMLTGLTPNEHGCVGNGWYFRDVAEVSFWKQSNNLVAGEKLWETARRRDPNFTCAKLFWWYNMYSSADISVTPRPIYFADGRKEPDIYTQPSDLRDELQRHLGTFPLMNFWGPKADARSSAWIARCAKYVFERYHPTLTLVYLPHLDYDLQRFGPASWQARNAASAIDSICGDLFEYFARSGTRIIVLSEYNIMEVAAPVHINRVLRRAGLLKIRQEKNQEKLDAGASQAFAVADHQIAHVYIKHAKTVKEVKSLLQSTSGIDTVLDSKGKRAHCLDHPRAGDLVAISEPNRWFSYYYWLDDDWAPDFARTVDIHRKPGFDPAELFFDAKVPFVRLRALGKLVVNRLGVRTLLDVIPLHGSMVRGSHGRLPASTNEAPMLATSVPHLLQSSSEIHATDVKSLVLDHLFIPAAMPQRHFRAL